MLALTCTAFLAAGCQSQIPSDLGDEMGNAQPVASPPSSDPAGEVIALPVSVAKVQAVERVGNTLAVRSAETIALGTVEDFRSGDAVEVSIPAECGELSAASDSFVLACGQEVRLYPADHPREEQVRSVEHRATAATLLSSGELATANDSEDEVVIYPPQGDPVVIGVEAPTTQLLSQPISGAPDALVRTWAEDTTIQDIDWTNEREGGRLRVGLGVGRISTGTEELLLASDTTGDQLAVYTTDDVVRLHQTAPVPDSPWAVAWDESHRLAWVASTAGNILTGWDISQGVPEQRHSLSTVANATSLLALDNGTLVLASASGEGLQVINNPTSST
ncbi:hypothetical protein Clow_01896 [Corynebacterium lowii]|uniref:Lipoprotein LpqB n=2 Tax=Corynebacterium lowii TaxID=1544413 RepID=A0A0Q0U1U4_9CORY|nr:hypothetical protein Clow_01896 [Corynebacterium lowii]